MIYFGCFQVADTKQKRKKGIFTKQGGDKEVLVGSKSVHLIYTLLSTFCVGIYPQPFSKRRMGIPVMYLPNLMTGIKTLKAHLFTIPYLSVFLPYIAK